MLSAHNSYEANTKQKKYQEKKRNETKRHDTTESNGTKNKNKISCRTHRIESNQPANKRNVEAKLMRAWIIERLNWYT